MLRFFAIFYILSPLSTLAQGGFCAEEASSHRVTTASFAETPSTKNISVEEQEEQLWRQRQLRKQQSDYSCKLELAMRWGTLCGFTQENKLRVRLIMSGYAKWKAKLLSLYSEKGAMLGFTEENKVAIVESLNEAQRRVRLMNDDNLLKILSYFDYHGKWLHWYEEQKVELIRALYDPDPDTHLHVAYGFEVAESLRTGAFSQFSDQNKARLTEIMSKFARWKRKLLVQCSEHGPLFDFSEANKMKLFEVLHGHQLADERLVEILSNFDGSYYDEHSLLRLPQNNSVEVIEELCVDDFLIEPSEGVVQGSESQMEEID